MDANEPSAGPQLVELKPLVAAANAGDERALATLRQLLDENPQVWNTMADMGRQVETMLTRLIAVTDKLLAESLVRKLAGLRTSLSRPGATALEKLAIDRVVTTWLALHHVEMNLTGTTPGTIQGKFWLQRQSQADRSYSAAIRSLATLQKSIPISASRGAVATAPKSSAQHGPQSADAAPGVIPIDRAEAVDAAAQTSTAGATAEMRSTGS